jgi:tRNA (guanine6-N2)-methyltransferase
MPTYAASFVSGLQRVVGPAIEHACPDAEVEHLLDGLVVFRTDAPLDEIKRWRFINNLFLVIRSFSGLGDDTMTTMLEAVAAPDTWDDWDASAFRPGRTFRIVTSEQNQSVSVDAGLLRAAQVAVSNHTGSRPSTHKPETEFWALRRSEGLGLFMQRLTRHASFERMLDRGELRPDLCHALCLLSEPNDDDVFLDPFCGSGAIPLGRARSFPFKLIFATDTDADKTSQLRRTVKGMRTKRLVRSFIARPADALDMSKLDDGFVTRIVTDPPWGLFEDVGMNVAEFYAKMLREFRRVLAPGGIAVILTAAKDELAAAVDALDDVDVQETYDILVSGKKAAIYKLVKTV